MQSDGKGGRGRAIAALFLVMALAAGVRVAYLKGYQESPFFETPLADSASNINQAKVIETSGSLGEEPLAQPPLYPLALSLIIRTGDGEALARWVQAGMGVAVACLVFVVARLLLGTAGALMAGLFCAFYGPAIYYETHYIPASVMLLVFACYWLASVWAWRRGSIWLWFVSGLLLGAMAGMSIGAFTLVLPAVLLALRRREGIKTVRLWTVVVALAAGGLLPTLPFVIHNGRAGAAGVGVAQDGGISFYKANNPEATGLPPSMAEEQTWWHGQRYAEAEAAARSGHPLGPSQVSRYWFLRGLKFAVSDPVSYFRLLGRKLAHFWTRPELVVGPTPAFVAGNWIPWSKPLMYAFAALGPLALAGAWTIRKRPEAWAVYFPLIGALAFALVYTSEASTRLLAMPSVAALSAAFLVSLASKFRHGEWRSGAASIAVLLCAALGVNLLAPRVSKANPSPAEDHRLIGVVYEIEGKGPLALDQYDKAVRMAPKDSSCRLSLAAMLSSDGVADEAERHFLVAAAIDTLSPSPYLGLANLYRRNGLYEQALAALRKAMERAPYDVGIAVSLGRTCIDMGLYEQAEAYFKGALSIDPENATAIDGLLELRDRGIYVDIQNEEGKPQNTVRARIQEAMERLRQGDFDASKTILDELVKEAPDNLDVAFAMATWQLQAGNLDQAIQGYERCVKENPKNPVVLNNLASAYHETGRTEEAIAMWQKVLALDPNNLKAKTNLQRALSEANKAPQEQK
jgi:tetratricopeptide (TPR) repeat protein